MEVNYFKSWLIYTIIACIVAVVGGSIAGGIMGFALGFAKATPQTITITCGFLGMLVGLYASFYFYKWSINKYILPQVE